MAFILSERRRKSTRGSTTGTGGTTRIYYITNINGDTVTLNFNITIDNHIIIDNGLVLIINQDYHIVNSTTIILKEEVINLNLTFVVFNIGVSLEDLIKGKFKNDDDARAVVNSGDLYRLTADNDYGMAENTIRYLE